MNPECLGTDTHTGFSYGSAETGMAGERRHRCGDKSLDGKTSAFRSMPRKAVACDAHANRGTERRQRRPKKWSMFSKTVAPWRKFRVKWVSYSAKQRKDHNGRCVRVRETGLLFGNTYARADHHGMH